MEKELLAQFLNHYLSIATIVGSVFVIFWIIGICATAYFKKNCKISNFFFKNIFLVGFLVTLAGTLLTLFYSEYLGYKPCDLCWFQRIFLYPQIILFGLAMWKKDFGIFIYTLVLSLIGLAFAIYHHMLQIGYDIYKPCSEAPFAIDCAKPSFIEFGFVTFPFMAVVLFTFLAILSVVVMKHSKNLQNN